MNQIIRAISLAFRNLFNFKIFWILIWPLLVACLFWLIVSKFLWMPSVGSITEFVPLTIIKDWFGESGLQMFTHSIEGVLNVIILVMLVIVTTLIITALFGMPALIAFVAKRYYPLLDRKNGGSIMGSLLHVISAVVVFLVIWSISLPFWFIGVGILISFLATAYLNQRLFSYDALSEHASKEELKVLLKTGKLSLWSLGLLTGFIQFIPLLNFLAPTLTALAFIHFELARLENLRQKSDAHLSSK